MPWRTLESLYRGCFKKASHLCLMFTVLLSPHLHLILYKHLSEKRQAIVQDLVLVSMN